jgi:CheY-like chemotaxis protein
MPQAARAAPARHVSAEPPGGRAELPPCTVLLVDDDILVSNGTAAMLEDLGHTVVEAASALEALSVLGSGRKIDVVITDHAMPEMTGTELARRLRQSRPDLAVILATGYAESADDFLDLPRLSKPFLQEDLARAIARCAARDAVALSA